MSLTEESIIPLHGVRTPQHDFSVFNRQRRNTVIEVKMLLTTCGLPFFEIGW